MRFLSLPFALALAACSASPERAELEARDAVWRHLGERYDRDKDGRISPAEYDRGEAAFARLDRSGDGAIAPDDLARPVEMPPELAGPFLFVRAFGPEGAEAIGLEESERGFGRRDLDRNGRLVRGEFTATATRPDGAAEQFATLLTAVDGNGDRALTLDELGTYLERRDRDGDRRVSLRERSSPGKEPPTGFFERGTREAAPDFSLAPAAGGEPVSLSSFRGVRPVALVFGSFT